MKQICKYCTHHTHTHTHTQTRTFPNDPLPRTTMSLKSSKLSFGKPCESVFSSEPLRKSRFNSALRADNLLPLIVF